MASSDGIIDGEMEGCFEGINDGLADGIIEGAMDGCFEGNNDG